MNKLIINLAPTGMVPTREMTPHVPLSVEEIVRDVRTCAGLGASIAHIHARDPDGLPTQDNRVFQQIIRGIRQQEKDIIICVTTSGRKNPDLESRSQVLDLEGDCKPDMASLTLGSLNFARTASVNSPDTIMGLLDKMNQRGIKPELEVFDLGMINFAHYLIKKGMLQPPYYFNLLLGNISTAQAELSVVAHMIHDLPQPSIWALAGIGNCQRLVTSLSVLLGGHVRIGLEDNIYFSEDRSLLATNEMLVGRVVQMAQLMGTSISTPMETRQALGLPSWDGTISAAA